MAGMNKRLGGGPSPEFRARLREELDALQADKSTEEADDPAPAPSRRRRFRLLPQAVTIALTGAVVVTGFATYCSVPGDVLYPVKRAAENTLVNLSTSDVQRGERELSSARTRAEEVATLLGSPEREELVGTTLKDMEDTTRLAIATLSRVKHPGARPHTELQRFAKEQRNMVEPMLPQMDAETQRQANGYLNLIDGLTSPG
ncbi:hypothetical protein Ssi02_38400 [Sinosporangium siamense]|uniref:DUF5667 domain-containing protein n=2 Tax=Sinosporangium siamense TaxID=1367973 RepID=A0A919RKK1_9ACTN|nr:hypothetical protein Ssi02_38400 [Sinosporangium siamense]